MRHCQACGVGVVPLYHVQGPLLSTDIVHLSNWKKSTVIRTVCWEGSMRLDGEADPTPSDHARHCGVWQCCFLCPWCPELIRSTLQEQIVRFSGILWASWCHVGSLKSVLVRVFILQKSADILCQGFSLLWRAIFKTFSNIPLVFVVILQGADWCQRTTFLFPWSCVRELLPLVPSSPQARSCPFPASARLLPLLPHHWGVLFSSIWLFLMPLLVLNIKRGVPN